MRRIALVILVCSVIFVIQSCGKSAPGTKTEIKEAEAEYEIREALRNHMERKLTEFRRGEAVLKYAGKVEYFMKQPIKLFSGLTACGYTGRVPFEVEVVKGYEKDKNLNAEDIFKYI